MQMWTNVHEETKYYSHFTDVTETASSRFVIKDGNKRMPCTNTHETFVGISQAVLHFLMKSDDVLWGNYLNVSIFCFQVSVLLRVRHAKIKLAGTR